MLKWWWLWQAVSLTHFPTPHMSVHSSPSRTHPWSVHFHHDFGLSSPHAEALGSFGVSRRCSSSLRVAEAPTHCNSRPCCCFVHPRAKSELFSPHAGPLLLESSCREIGYVFPVYFAVGCKFFLTHRGLGRFPYCESHAHCRVFGLLFSLCFVGWCAQIRFGSPLISNSWAEFLYFGTVDWCYPSWCVVAADIPWFGCCY